MLWANASHRRTARASDLPTWWILQRRSFREATAEQTHYLPHQDGYVGCTVARAAGEGRLSLAAELFTSS